MEVYNGRTCSFNLLGVPSVEQRQLRMELVSAIESSVLNAAVFIATVLDMKELCKDLIKCEQS